jgi:hypothetical protein
MRRCRSSSASCLITAVWIMVISKHSHGASLFGRMIAETNVQGHRVFLEVEPQRIPPISSKHHDVFKFSSILRIGNSSFDKPPKPRWEPEVRKSANLSGHSATHAEKLQIVLHDSTFSLAVSPRTHWSIIAKFEQWRRGILLLECNGPSSTRSSVEVDTIPGVAQPLIVVQHTAGAWG